jgi:predicted dehydrogenase
MTFSSSSPAGIGIVGCGNIAERYVKGISRFPLLKTLGCADIYQEAADRLSASAGISAYPSVEALLDDPGVDVVVNITSPVAHAEVSFAALKAGKHVYVEKPMGATVAEGRRMIEAAVAAGRVLGSAPDTFLGSSAQTARAAVDNGVIGEPIGAVGFVTHSKAETWHPDPTFLFKPGGGPVLDLGPYYITALVNLLGPVASVAGFSRVGAPVRTVTAPGRRVDKITVEVPTHAVASLEFASGALATTCPIWRSMGRKGLSGCSTPTSTTARW